MKTLNVRNVCCNIIFFCLLFIFISTGNQYIDKVFNIVDEGILLLLYLYIAVNWKELGRNQLIIFVWTLFMMTGVIGSIMWHQQKWIAVLMDAIVVTNKFFITYIGASVFFFKNKDYKIESIVSVARIIVITLFVISMHDMFMTPWFASVGDKRFFFDTQALCFPHPTFLTHVGATLLIYFGFVSVKSKKIYPIEMIMASWLIIVAARAKGLGFLALFWMLFVFFFIFKIKQLGAMLAVGTASAVVFGADLIVANFMDTNIFSPRRVLFVDAAKIMNEEFLFGKGFASFVSSMANKYYSPLYKQLGYQYYTGMGEHDQLFLSDGFWPTIMAQFGWLGLFLFVVILVIYGVKTYRIIKRNRACGFAMLMVMAYSLISSMAETSFFNPISMLLFIIFAYAEVSAIEFEEEENVRPSER